MNSGERAGSNKNESNNVIKSVETSITIIECLQEREEAKVGEIAEVTGSSKGNVSKHLTTLAKHGFVDKTENGCKLGLRYLDLGGFVQDNVQGARLIKPKIRELADITDEVAQFAVESNGRSVIIYRETGQQGVSTRTRVGRHLPMHQVASGKAMLAQMPEEKIEEIIQTHGMHAATENTITDKETLLEELAEVRQENIAINNAESTKGLYAVAAPITMSSGDVVGACSVSGPSHRMHNEEKIAEVKDILLSFINEIELNLTYS